MIIACPACGTRYAVPDTAIGLEGRTVRCAKCRHSWFQDGAELAAPLEEAVTAGAAPSAPVAASAPVAPVATRPAIVTPPRTPAPAPEAPETVAVPAPIEDEELPAAPPAPAPRRADRAPGGHQDTAGGLYDESYDQSSSFDYAPPFRRRRNWARIATWAASVFAVVTLGAAGAVAWGGLPDWVPIPRDTFQQAPADLKLDFPRNRQDRKPLPDGTQFFSVSGTISNIGAQSRHVPSLLVALRNQRETIVYEKEIVPSKRDLAPGETITVNEALTDIPKAATSAEIGWKPE